MADRERPLEEEVEFEDMCPWLEEGREDEDEQEEVEEEVVDVVEDEVEWIIVEEVGDEDEEEQEKEEEKEDDGDVGVGGEGKDEERIGEPEEEQSGGGEMEQEEDVRLVQVVEPATSKKKIRKIHCPVCGEQFRHLFRHAAAHLPWFWYSSTCCQLCHTQHVHNKSLYFHLQEEHGTDQQPDMDASLLADLVMGTLQQFISYLDVDNLDGLVKFINEDPEIVRICNKKGKELTETDLELCHSLDLKLEKPPSTFSLLDNSGNFTVYALVHWRIFLQLLSKLSVEDRYSITLFQLPSTEELPSEDNEDNNPTKSADDADSMPLMITDAHVHLGHILDSVGDPDLLELDHFGGRPKFDVSMKYLVNNYCFPDNWPKSAALTVLNSKIPGHRISFGIHPKVVQSTPYYLLGEYCYTLEELLKQPNTIAVGECGLDTSDSSKKFRMLQQVEFFERQLELAISCQLPIIIHCRGDAVTHYKLLDSLEKLCPSDHPIHWHCFTGIPQVLERATTRFNNIVFGITPFIFNKPHVESLVHLQPLSSFVLESDAPFIYFNQHPSDPYTVAFVAEKIAELLGMSVKDVINTTTCNMERIYQL